MTLSIKAFATAAIISVAVLSASTGQADAARYRFGTDESLTAYAKTGMTHELKPVDLCYKTKTINVFAPVYTSDEMVLCDVSKKTYWPIPTGERLKTLQRAGLLPNPLPAYTRPLLDYLFGFSLWIALAGFGLFAGISVMFGSRSQEDSASEQTA